MSTAKSKPQAEVPAYKSESYETVRFSELYHGDNPRPALKPADVRGLAETIRRHGMLQPIVVARVAGRKGYLLLAGHRRVAAALSIGWSEGQAHVLELGPGGASPAELQARVALVENGQREALDPLREAEVVQQLLGLPGRTVDDVAHDLGRPRAWVLRRARLRMLAPEAVKAARPGGELAEWPTSWLEDLALLEPADQAALVAAQGETYGRVASRRALRVVVRERLRTLGSAPWDLEDAELAPKAGACSKCPKHTAAQVGLFEELVAPKLPEARCLDGACFRAKLAAWSERAVAAARAKYGDALLLVSGPALEQRRRFDPDEDAARDTLRELEHQREMADEDAGVAPEDGPTAPLPHYAVSEAKRGDKGAVPALVVDGAGAGRVRWVRRERETQGGAGGAKRAAGPKPLAKRLEELQRRRRAHVVRAFRRDLEGWGRREVPADLVARGHADPAWLVRLVAAWGARADHAAPAERAKRLNDLKGAPAATLEHLVSSWREVIEEPRGQSQAVDRSYAEVELVLGIDGLAMGKRLEELRQAALAELPEPKSWAAERAATRSRKPAKAAAGKTPRRAPKSPARKPARPAKAGAKAGAAGSGAPARPEPDPDEGDPAGGAAVLLGESRRAAGRRRGAAPEAADPLRDAVEGRPVPGQARCRVCGCTDERACAGGCSWVEPDLCSSCKQLPAGARRRQAAARKAG